MMAMKVTGKELQTSHLIFLKDKEGFIVDKDRFRLVPKEKVSLAEINEYLKMKIKVLVMDKHTRVIAKNWLGV